MLSKSHFVLFPHQSTGIASLRKLRRVQDPLATTFTTNPTKCIGTKLHSGHRQVQHRFCKIQSHIPIPPSHKAPGTPVLQYFQLSGFKLSQAPLCGTVVELEAAMCRLIKVTHFGCDNSHSEYVLTRCKAGYEYVLNMPITGGCKGTVEVEDWVMSPCRFCKEYSERPVSGRGRALSLQADELPDDKDSPMTGSGYDKGAMLKAKMSLDSSLCTKTESPSEMPAPLNLAIRSRAAADSSHRGQTRP
ncbi:hypothetical protein EDD37DRAFT_138688 [Exophiala viscosa]|uniref:Uncharacterized protein n=1 Tax=Exophiala viscosa TaxID=2486360 RepID=A0AAN6DQT0_9EURO|nr:hypothetical protein EDD36DRAFT_83790 [Exophiala viscosa]KAI1620937.1 hypothetical protein EDD37DRAFT_138688 [Exophiala viscosa]